jgi:hypothetical protein
MISVEGDFGAFRQVLAMDLFEVRARSVMWYAYAHACVQGGAK